METPFGRAYFQRDRWRVKNQGKELHVLIWEEAYGPKPKGYDIHHIDHNPRNNELSNLACITKSEHKRIHAGWRQVDGRWIAKPCADCRQLLPLEQFYKLNYKDGWDSRCKECCRMRDKRRDKRKPDARRPPLITFNGKSQTLADWGRELGITYASLKSRLRHGWSLEKAMSSPTMTRWEHVRARVGKSPSVILGEQDRANRKALCERLGLNYHTVQSRLQRGWTLERAISEPVLPRRN